MRWSFFSSLCIIGFVIQATIALPNSLENAEENYPLESYVKMRCSVDPNDLDTYMQFRGFVYSTMDGSAPMTLFQTLGVNVANCLKQNDGSYYLTTREIMLYLDPKTGKKLSKWDNPFTKKTVNVVHVFNDPVQMSLSNEVPYPFTVDKKQNVAQQTEDVPLFYPNPLYGNSSFASYAPTPDYQGGEYFSFQVSLDDLNDQNLSKIENVHYTWTRTSQFLPFMGMGDNIDQYERSYLLFSSHGTRLSSFNDLDPILKNEIENRVPLMKHAPTCQLDIPNETSWTYFQKNFENYLAGAEFPIPKTKENASCVKKEKNN